MYLGGGTGSMPTLTAIHEYDAVMTPNVQHYKYNLGSVIVDPDVTLKPLLYIDPLLSIMACNSLYSFTFPFQPNPPGALYIIKLSSYNTIGNADIISFGINCHCLNLEFNSNRYLYLIDQPSPPKIFLVAVTIVDPTTLTLEKTDIVVGFTG